MIASVIYYPSGYTGAITTENCHDPAVSEPWYVSVLRVYMRHGLINDKTLISVPATYQGPVSGIRPLHFLPESSDDPSYFSLLFYPNGKTLAQDFTGSQLSLEPWHITAARDLLSRNMVPPDARLLVPNVYAGTFRQLLQPAVGASSTS